MPKDPAPNVPSLNTAASRWKEEHLNMLNVMYEPKHFYPINIDPTDIPPEVSERISFLTFNFLGIKAISDGMRSLDMQAVIERKIIFFDNITAWPAFRFESAYVALIRVLAKAPRLEPSTRRPEPPPSSFARDPEKTPPTNSTVPTNPTFFSDSKAKV
jgi:hypothetical protein